MPVTAKPINGQERVQQNKLVSSRTVAHDTRCLRTIFLCSIVMLDSLVPATASASELTAEACEALTGEHTTLLEAGAGTDIERGPDWAKDNLGELRLQRVQRLIEVEEQIAFRCSQTRLADAVLFPDLKLRKGGSAAAGHVLRVSLVPVPLKRPALSEKQIKPNFETNPQRRTSPVTAPVTTSSVQPAKVSPPQPGAPANAKGVVVIAPKSSANTANKPDSEHTTAAVEPAQQPGKATAKSEDELPKVIRLQAPDSNAKPAPNIRRATVSQQRKKRIKRNDAYVPPPVRPGYMPSLDSP